MPDPDFSGSGGIFVGPNGQPVSLRNTLLADNYTSGAPIPDNCNGMIRSFGRNLFGDVSGCSITTASGSWGLLAPGSFGDLGNHGGPTPTVELLAGSNAIDAATLDGGCKDENGPLTTDQRGFPRTGACDVGAFEYGAVDPYWIFHNGFE